MRKITLMLTTAFHSVTMAITLITTGIAFALANTPNHARKLIKENSQPWEWEAYKNDIADEPKVYREPFGFWMR